MNKKAVVIDIETSGLLEDMVDYSSFPYKLKDDAKLWVVSFCDVRTGKIVSKVKEDITRKWLEHVISYYDVIIAHNGLKFDFIALQLFGLLDYKVSFSGESTIYGKPVEFADTLVWSRLFYPDRFGGHSLEVWGERLGNPKTDFRQVCIDKGYISPDSPKGAEFQQYSEEMRFYCEQDTKVNRDIYLALLQERESYEGWEQSIRQEIKLADLAVRRENLGFFFDKELAIQCVKDLTNKMDSIEQSINPILPKKRMNVGETKYYTPPKNQFKKDGTPSANLITFAEKVGGVILQREDKSYFLGYGTTEINLPRTEPIIKRLPATISDLDHIKMYLIYLGWEPIEWRERDLTKDAKKQNLPYDKRIKALERWVDETFNGKYKDKRLDIIEMYDKQEILEVYREKLREDYPVRVPTSPSLRVGVEKELCPGLTKLGDKVAFAKDFALYLTYKHRKNSIAGGDIEDMDFDKEYPNSGYLSQYREVDGRIPTPAIELGSATNRYRHISVVNIPRVSSVYGDNMRALFGSGKGFVLYNFDFSSLEARIMGHYVKKYPKGDEMISMLLSEKPNDWHSVTSRKLGIPRTDCKSINYGLIYGSAPKKVAKMVNVDLERGKEIHDEAWNAMPALKALRDKLTEFWEKNHKKFIVSIDGRKIFTRSKHSLLNFLFQSAGVICAKYTMIFLYEILENKGLCLDPFIGKPDFCSMGEFHDEIAAVLNPKLLNVKKFETEDLAKNYSKDNKGYSVSGVGHTKDNKYFVGSPNIVSKATEEAIVKVNNIFKLNVPLGMEWNVGRNWSETH